MKKLALAVAILAAGAGGYWYSQQQGQNALSNPALDYIPADTPLFSAQLKPFPLKDYLKATAANTAMMAEDPVLAEMLADTSEPAIRFGAFLYKAYLDGLKDPDALIKRFGLSEQPRGYFYTLGALPVARMEVANAAAFWALLDEAETFSGFKHSVGTVAGQSYRAYTLGEPGADATKIELVVAEREGMVSVSLNTSMQDAALLEHALGVTKVANPISATSQIADIIKTHGFLEDSISFINHQELVRAVVSGDNQLGKQLSALVAEEGEDPFQAIRTAECQTELNAIAANWPRTVAGLTTLKVDSQQTSMDMKLVVETKNAVVLAALEKMRGFLPSYTTNPQNSVIAMGLGLDVSELAPSLTKVWNDAMQPKLQCQPLAELQAQLSELNPAMLGMATGMADGVKGIAAALIDYQLEVVDDEPKLNKLDALISLSAEDPALLFNMVKPFAPVLGQIELKAGEDVDLSGFIPPEFGVSAKLGLRGQHMVVYSGEGGKKAADALSSEKLSANGLYGMSADYGRMMGPLMTLLEASGEEVPPELSGMENFNMKIQMAVDVNAQGPVFRSGFVMKP
ncbi:hypothetical protein KJI95_04080 [Shewanella sp. JM162201]|uniref:DUF3352 domain-containing protein n=1 Tax=Shewanella jiangmenensis TaxID=2837387 RepID=A0ABS5UZR9_9GAMM|nr:hypothetical protein [Shewanella jiangmenensis]MBT1443703.1 hypothetical protein [Shewanella jiangmenensis]